MMISDLKFQISDRRKVGRIEDEQELSVSSVRFSGRPVHGTDGTNETDAIERDDGWCARSMFLAGGPPQAKELDHFGPIKWSRLEMRMMGERSDAWMISNFKPEKGLCKPLVFGLLQAGGLRKWLVFRGLQAGRRLEGVLRRCNLLIFRHLQAKKLLFFSNRRVAREKRNQKHLRKPEQQDELRCALGVVVFLDSFDKFFSGRMGIERRRSRNLARFPMRGSVLMDCPARHDLLH